MTDEEPGLLGNLPRSRPGTRSDKRGGASGSKPAPKRSQAPKTGASTAKAKARPAAKAKPAAAKAKPAAAKKAGAARPRKPAPTTPRKPAPATPRAARENPQTDPPSQSRPPSAGPLESAVKVAGAGLRVAEGVTREVLRRLPRP